MNLTLFNKLARPNAKGSSLATPPPSKEKIQALLEDKMARVKGRCDIDSRASGA